MRYNLKKFLILLGQSVIFWVISFLIFVVIRYNGLDQEYSVFFDEKFDLPTDMWIRFGIYLGFSIGVFYAIIEFIFDNYLSRKLILGLALIIKTVTYLVLMIFLLSYFIELAKIEFDLDIHYERGWWRSNKIFWTITLYFVITSLVFSFLKIASEKFGKGVFLKMLIGKYKQPQEEKRIFMFLDLKNSTTIAEELGHLKYSQLIQDCFFDLNSIVSKHDAEIYQYVGDEAVLTWPYKNGLKHNNCIETYFAFVNKLNEREDYYLENYNKKPIFKAGLHGGNLIIAEVGTIKKELAYHGDVINTSARIQSECNTYNETLLISENLIADLKLQSKFIVKHMGNVFLKGKQVGINILSVNKI